MKKYILIFGLILSFDVNAWENCGQIDGEDSNCEYQVSSDGVLTIRPIDSNQDAIMPEYLYSYNQTSDSAYQTTAPWYNERHSITSLQIEDGIQNISNNAFMEMRWLETVDMADSVLSIGTDAFTSDSRLTDVSLSKNLKIINNCAFQNADSLRKINLPEGLIRLGSAIFNFTENITALSIPDSLIDSKNFDISALNRSNIQTLYCSKEKEQACAKFIASAKKAGYAPEGLKYGVYEKYGTSYIYNGKFYNTLGDIGTPDYIPKRIYTIDEASKVAGKKNRFSIKYR